MSVTANDAWEARRRREVQAARRCGAQFLTASNAGDSERMEAIRRELNALLPLPGEYGAASGERARLLEAFNDAAIPSRRRA